MEGKLDKVDEVEMEVELGMSSARLSESVYVNTWLSGIP